MFSGSRVYLSLSALFFDPLASHAFVENGLLLRRQGFIAHDGFGIPRAQCLRGIGIKPAGNGLVFHRASLLYLGGFGSIGLCPFTVS